MPTGAYRAAMPDAPIGIFDSGIGGLTVLRRVRERLPRESLVYLGDTARVPYGSKSAETVCRYASTCAAVLLRRGVKLLVVACNTASAYALDHLREELDVPVIGVVEPGVHSALRASKSGRIGVIGTLGTIRSGAYQRAIESAAPNAVVFTKACPLFVPLAEEGWTTGDVPRRVAESYLANFRDTGIDTLVLGCTHYPLLHGVIADVMGPNVQLVDSAEATAEAVSQAIEGLGLQRESGDPSELILVSDNPENIATVGERFLNRPIERVEWVDF